MRLKVKTHHEPNARQAEMIAEYVRNDNKTEEEKFDDECVIYTLTDKGRMHIYDGYIQDARGQEPQKG